LNTHTVLLNYKLFFNSQDYAKCNRPFGPLIIVKSPVHFALGPVVAVPGPVEFIGIGNAGKESERKNACQQHRDNSFHKYSFL
jgi:hypothetical protein